MQERCQNMCAPWYETRQVLSVKICGRRPAVQPPWQASHEVIYRVATVIVLQSLMRCV